MEVLSLEQMERLIDPVTKNLKTMHDVTVMYFYNHEVVGVDIEVEAPTKDEAAKIALDLYNDKPIPAGHRLACAIAW